MRVDTYPQALTQPSAGIATQTSPKDEFLRLLVAQLKYQNPLDPQDGAEFVAQLAQFASLEQAAETNQRLGNLEAAHDAASRANLVSLTGRSVAARAERLYIDPSRGPVPELSVRLAKPATNVEVIVTDSSGNQVRAFNLGATSAGETALEWDGRDALGRELPPGEYRFELRAKDPAGEPIAGSVLVRGEITAIEFGPNSTDFYLGAATVRPSDIVALDGPVAPVLPAPAANP